MYSRFKIRQQLLHFSDTHNSTVYLIVMHDIQSLLVLSLSLSLSFSGPCALEKWFGYNKWLMLAIIAGGGSLLLILIVSLIVICCKNHRRHRRRQRGKFSPSPLSLSLSPTDSLSTHILLCRPQSIVMVQPVSPHYTQYIGLSVLCHSWNVNSVFVYS